MPQKFSITQEPQFDFRRTPMIPGTDVMQDSVMENFPIDPSKTGIEQLILNNIAQLSDANEGYINTSDVPQEQNIFQKGFDYMRGDRGGIARGILGLLTGGPIGALIGYNSPNIMSGVSDGISGLFKNFNDRRRGRLDVTADAGIMPGREIGALTTADDYGSGSDGGRSAAEQSFSDSQSYGGGGSMDDMGADSFY
tara:strand:+ start:25 stop:612 length:588 start_codon:yes stop_codon:yes gene_type:complete